MSDYESVEPRFAHFPATGSDWLRVVPAYPRVSPLRGGSQAQFEALANPRGIRMPELKTDIMSLNLQESADGQKFTVESNTTTVEISIRRKPANVATQADSTTAADKRSVENVVG